MPTYVYSTVCKDTSYNNIGSLGLAGKLATAGMTAPAETPERAGMKATAESRQH